MSGPIFGLCWEHLSILSRIIGFIRSQTRRNASRSTIAEANLDDTRSIFVRSRERSTTYRVKRSSDVAFFPIIYILLSIKFSSVQFSCGAVCMESFNLRSGFPYIFCRGGKVRLIQFLTFCLLLVQNLDFSLIGQETKRYLELSHDWLLLWRYDFR